jgi:hypothetical protein
MTASTVERNFEFRPSPGNTFNTFPVLANNKPLLGCLVTTVNATGYAKNAVKETGVVVQGVAKETKDNTGGANGALRVAVYSGLVPLLSVEGDDAVGLDDIGKRCYLEDNQTVTMLSTGTVAVGLVHSIEGSIIWVQAGPIVQLA